MQSDSEMMLGNMLIVWFDSTVDAVVGCNSAGVVDYSQSDTHIIESERDVDAQFCLVLGARDFVVSFRA